MICEWARDSILGTATRLDRARDARLEAEFGSSIIQGKTIPGQRAGTHNEGYSRKRETMVQVAGVLWRAIYMAIAARISRMSPDRHTNVIGLKLESKTIPITNMYWM